MSEGGLKPGLVAELTRAAGVPEELLVRATSLLSDPSRVAPEIGDPPAALHLAKEAWAAFQTETRRAWVRFPGIRPAGAHGGEPDSRAIQLFATLTYVERAGFYLPEELSERFAAGDVPGAWVAKEALRVRVLLVLLERLAAGLDDGAVASMAYADGVTALAKQVGRIAIAGQPDS